MEGVEILKRGYLYDKKVGILPKSVDRKRWYVLKRELVGSAGAGVGGAAGTGVKVTLEIYKDEKAATKSEGPKGLIDIGNVVTVQRVTTKKQTFEILCPGVGYKLMANSDLEVDEWMQAIQLHITYKRNGHGSESFLSSSTSSLPILSQDAAALRSSSLGRGGYPGGHSHHQPHPSTHHMMSHLNSSHHPHHHQDNRMRTLSDSSGHPLSAGTVCSPGHTHFYHAHHQQPSSQHQYFHGQHTHQTVPIGLPAQRGMVHISHTLPTPPHSVSPPSYQPYHFSPVSGSGVPFQRQRSLESAAASSMASPSTSSDSSSMCSGSNTSFEGGGAGGGGGSSTGVFESDGWESRSTFRVQVNDPEHLKIVGLADLTVNDDGLRLHSLPPDQKELVFWPLGSLRKYGNSNHYFTIITGRFCATGEGRFQFFSEESNLIQARLHSFATQKAGRGKVMPRRASEPGDTTVSLHAVNPSHSLPPTATLLPYSSSPTSPLFGSDHEYSRLQYCTGQSGTFSSHGPMIRPNLHPSQSLPIGAHLMGGKMFVQQGSLTTKNHTMVAQPPLPPPPLPPPPQIHPRSQAPLPPSSLPDSSLGEDSYNNDSSKEESRTSSPGSSSNQSTQNQNQTLKTCMSSESSSSAGDSGCVSEAPRLSPDHDYEGIPQN